MIIKRSALATVAVLVPLLIGTTVVRSQVGPNEFAAFLGDSDTEFPKFIRERVGKVVKLTLNFNSKPYDYRGEPDLGLWDAPSAGFFFDCKGSWDNKTGYAAAGRITGNWRVISSKKLGGKPYYTLKCVS